MDGERGDNIYQSVVLFIYFHLGLTPLEDSTYINSYSVLAVLRFGMEMTFQSALIYKNVFPISDSSPDAKL